MSPKIFSYSPVNGEFLGEGQADESPLEPGIFLVPANATLDKPPAARNDQIAVRVDGAWRLIDVVQPMPQPPVVPTVVSMRQARLALLGAGLLATVNAAVAAMPGAAGEAARIEWEYSGEVHRNKALVQALAPVLGLNDAQLDALFVAAAAL